MLSSFGGERIVAACFADADDVLSLPLSTIVREGPEDRLNPTAIAQPALLTASIALWRLWCERGGVLPSAMAGHSLGEYSALVAAGAVDFADAVKLVHLRGKLMQDAVPAGAGAMAAVLGLDDAVIEKCCAEVTTGVVSAANFNAPGQVVIAGDAAAVDAAIERCKAAGARRAVKLAVSVPSHCRLMLPASEKFASALDDVVFRVPSIPVVHNVDADVSGDVEGIRRRLTAQLSEPVRWSTCVARLTARGVGKIAECGPGNVLAGLIKRIDRNVEVSGLGDATSFDTTLAAGNA
jgi:[acyl-carrier-protein] S-malonyltransferase